MSDKPTTIAECFELLKDPKFSELNVNFLEGGTQVMALALAALGYSINSEERGRDRRGQASARSRSSRTSTRSTRRYIERAQRGEIDFGMGWNGDVRRAIVTLAEKDREMVFLVPDGPTEYWVDNWVIPADAEHPVAAHKWIDFVLDPVNAGKEMNYHQYPVPVEGIKGVEPELANDPVINVPDEKIAGLRVPDRDGEGPAAAQPRLHGVQGRLTMAVADATPSAAPAAARAARPRRSARSPGW